MRIHVTAKAEPPGPLGNNKPRLVFDGPIWKDWGDIEFCVHGEKMRWTCDHCDEYFQRHKVQMFSVSDQTEVPI